MNIWKIENPKNRQVLIGADSRILLSPLIWKSWNQKSYLCRQGLSLIHHLKSHQNLPQKQAWICRWALAERAISPSTFRKVQKTTSILRKWFRENRAHFGSFYCFDFPKARRQIHYGKTAAVFKTSWKSRKDPCNSPREIDYNLSYLSCSDWPCNTWGSPQPESETAVLSRDVKLSFTKTLTARSILWALESAKASLGDLAQNTLILWERAWLGDWGNFNIIINYDWGVLRRKLTSYSAYSFCEV